MGCASSTATPSTAVAAAAAAAATTVPRTTHPLSYSAIPLITASLPSPSKYAVESTTLPATTPSRNQLHLHYLPIELYALIFQYVETPDVGCQDCLQHKSFNNQMNLHLVWRQKCEQEYQLYSPIGYRKIGGIVVSNRTHELTWKDLYKLRTRLPTAQYLQFRTSSNDNYVVPIKQASRRPTPKRSSNSPEEQWFLQITSDKVLGKNAHSGASGNRAGFGRGSPPRRAPQRLRGIDVLRTVARGRKRLRSTRHINNKLRVRRSTSPALSAAHTVLVMLCIFVVGLLHDPVDAGVSTTTTMHGSNLLIGEDVCMTDPITHNVVVSNIDRRHAHAYRSERTLVQSLFANNANNANNTRAMSALVPPSASDHTMAGKKVNQAADLRYGTHETAHECSESTCEFSFCVSSDAVFFSSIVQCSNRLEHEHVY